MTTVTNPARSNVGPALQQEVEQFLYDEADILDERRFDEWLTMLGKDIHYWMPLKTNRLIRQASLETTGPRDMAYFDETWIQLEQRVRRLATGMAWAEDPPSRTRHLVTNVRVRTSDDPTSEEHDEYDVEASFFLYRSRLEREVDLFVGKRYDKLRATGGRWGFEVVNREIHLDQGTLLAKNLSVFF